MKYLALIQCNVRHAYYADGRCPDLTFTPDAATAQLLRNQRMICRTQADGFKIFVNATHNAEALIALPQTMLLTFAVTLNDQAFTQFTDLSAHRAATNPTYSNMADANTLQLQSRPQMMTETLRVVTPAADEKLVLAGSPQAQTISDFSISGLADLSQPSQYDPAGKVLTVDTRNAHKGATFQITYPAAPALSRTFATLEVRYDSAANTLSKPLQVTLTFAPKQWRWLYYVISASENPQIINQNGSAVSFSTANRVHLNANPDESDPLAVSLAERFPSAQRYRFASDALVPCQQHAHTALRLRVNDAMLSDPLPNPASSNLAVHNVARDGTIHKEDALYHVIKFLAPQSIVR